MCVWFHTRIWSHTRNQIWAVSMTFLVPLVFNPMWWCTVSPPIPTVDEVLRALQGLTECTSTECHEPLVRPPSSSPPADLLLPLLMATVATLATLAATGGTQRAKP